MTSFRRIVACSLVSLLSAFGCSSTTTGTGAPASSGGSMDAGGAQTCSPFDSTHTCSTGECIEGYCLTPSASCHVADDGKDGCDDRSFCYAGTNGNRCYALPDCPANGICAPSPFSTNAGGEKGAVCNSSGGGGKANVCVFGRCLGDADCEMGHCAIRKVGDAFGHCSGPVATGTGSNGAGGAWEDSPGCATSPSSLIGTKPLGATCSSPKDCKPTCCTCGGGAGALLAAICDLDPNNPITGKCGSAADACKAAFYQGDYGNCAAP